MSKIPLTSLDFSRGAFSKAAKHIFSHWPDSAVKKLSHAQEFLSKSLGYDDFHDAQQSAVANPVFSLTPEEYLVIINTQKPMGTMPVNGSEYTFTIQSPIKFLGAFNTGRKTSSLINQAILDEINIAHVRDWKESLYDYEGRTGFLSFRQLATSVLSQLPQEEAIQSLNITIGEFFLSGKFDKVRPGLLSEFDELTNKKTSELLRGIIHEYYGVAICDMVKTSGIKPEKIIEYYKTPEVFGRIVDTNHRRFMVELSTAQLLTIFQRQSLGNLHDLPDIIERYSFNSRDVINSEMNELIRKAVGESVLTYEEFLEYNPELDSEDSSSQSEYKKKLELDEEELSEEIEAIRDEFADELALDSHCITKPYSNGNLNFNIIEIPGDSDELSFTAYKWNGTFTKENNAPEVFICGTLYKSQGEFITTAGDILWFADNFTEDRTRFLEKYLEAINKNDGINSISDADIESRLEYGPLIFISYMERNTDDASTKGYGLDLLDFSLNEILAYFETDECNVVADIFPSQFLSYCEEEPPSITDLKINAAKTITGYLWSYFDNRFDGVHECHLIPFYR
jgi:hypothetical protein